MSAIANIVAFDGAATPVVHTLVPISISNMNGEMVALWRESNIALPLMAQIQASAKRRMIKSGSEQVSIAVSVPVMEAINAQNAAGYTAAPKVAYVNTVVITGYFNPRATIAERRLARQLAINIAGSIATTVTPVATGPAPELIDMAIAPS